MEIASHKHPRYDGSERRLSARGRRAIGEFTATLVKGESLGQELKPDYEAICERTLNLPEMGRQSAEARRLTHLSGNCLRVSANNKAPGDLPRANVSCLNSV